MVQHRCWNQRCFLFLVPSNCASGGFQIQNLDAEKGYVYVQFESLKRGYIDDVEFLVTLGSFSRDPADLASWVFETLKSGLFMFVLLCSIMFYSHIIIEFLVILAIISCILIEPCLAS